MSIPVPDWSAVEWYVYESPRGTRVLPRELSDGECRDREKFAIKVVGVSRKTVVQLLKCGVQPSKLAMAISFMAENQYKRSASDHQPNRYLEHLERVKKLKQEEYEQQKAAA